MNAPDEHWVGVKTPHVSTHRASMPSSSSMFQTPHADELEHIILSFQTGVFCFTRRKLLYKKRTCLSRFYHSHSRRARHRRNRNPCAVPIYMSAALPPQLCHLKPPFNPLCQIPVCNNCTSYGDLTSLKYHVCPSCFPSQLNTPLMSQL